MFFDIELQGSLHKIVKTKLQACQSRNNFFSYENRHLLFPQKSSAHSTVAFTANNGPQKQPINSWSALFPDAAATSWVLPGQEQVLGASIGKFGDF